MTVDALAIADVETTVTPGRASRRAWSGDEDDALRRLCAQRLSLRTMAARLGRRASSVGCRMKILGLQAAPRPVRPRPGRPVWPDWVRFEDDPRACRPEPMWRGAPAAARSLHGCASALLEDEA